MNFNEYVKNEQAKATLTESAVTYGATTECKVEEGSMCKPHSHTYYVDENGFGQTDVANKGYAHWHMIIDNKIVAEGDHTHELGKKVGEINGWQNIDRSGYIFNSDAEISNRGQVKV